MAMVGVDDSSVQTDSQTKSVGLFCESRQVLGVLHSLDEPHECTQWLCHHNIIINVDSKYQYSQCSNYSGSNGWTIKTQWSSFWPAWSPDDDDDDELCFSSSQLS